MSSIHLAAPDGTQTVHEESAARDLWTQGLLAPDCLYWREGMAEWRPAAEFFGAVTPPAEAAAPVIAHANLPPRGFTKDPTRLTKVLVLALWIGVAMAGLNAIIEIFSMATGNATASAEELTPTDLVIALAGLLQLPILIFTGVVFLMWIYRAHINAQGLGARNMQFTAGWSIGWYFIPILNLWKPYQAMKEIWQASKNPGAWRAEQAPTLLSVWWGFWIVDNMLGNISFRLAFRAESPAQLMASAVVSVLSEITGIILCLVAMRLVRSIYQLQSAWAAQPRESCCAICNRAMPPEELIMLNHQYVCAGCKPTSLQRIVEGARFSP